MIYNLLVCTVVYTNQSLNFDTNSTVWCHFISNTWFNLILDSKRLVIYVGKTQWEVSMLAEQVT